MFEIMDFLESIGDAFQTIFDFIVSIFSFVGMLIEGVIWLISTLPGLVTQITAVFAYCPSFIGIFLTCSLSIIVLYAIFKLI